MDRKERVVHLGRWVKCDVCKMRGVEPPQAAKYDANLTLGTWGYVCEEHMTQYGRGLGIGLGCRITK